MCFFTNIQQVSPANKIKYKKVLCCDEKSSACYLAVLLLLMEKNHIKCIVANIIVVVFKNT